MKEAMWIWNWKTDRITMKKTIEITVSEENAENMAEPTKGFDDEEDRDPGPIKEPDSKEKDSDASPSSQMEEVFLSPPSCFTTDERNNIVVGFVDGIVQFANYDVSKKLFKTQWKFKTKASVRGLLFNRDQSEVFAITSNRGLSCFDVETGRRKRCLVRGHDDKPTSICLLQPNASKFQQFATGDEVRRGTYLGSPSKFSNDLFLEGARSGRDGYLEVFVHGEYGNLLERIETGFEMGVDDVVELRKGLLMTCSGSSDKLKTYKRNAN
ncbi:hypothetical protein OSTOST_17457 [Ostertagia ostertagi]